MTHVRTGAVRAMVGALAFSSVQTGCQSGGTGAEPTTVDRAGAIEPANAPGAATEHLALSELRERAIGLIIDATRDGHPEVRTNAVEALDKAPARAEPIVAAALKDENPAVRTVAAMTVARLHLRSLAAATRPLIDDESNYCRAAAIYALSACGEGVNPTALATILFSDPSFRVRSHVVYILGEMGNPSAMGLIRQAAHDGVPNALPAQDKVFQVQAAEAMVKLGDPRAIQAIYSALYPGRPEELEATALAAQILGQLRDASSIDRLIYVIEYKNPQGQRYSAEVRLAAATALARIGNYRGGFVADEFWTSESAAIRAQSAFAYGEIGTPEAFANLEQMLGDPDPRVRVAAAHSVLNIVDVLGGPRSASGATHRPTHQ